MEAEPRRGAKSDYEQCRKQRNVEKGHRVRAGQLRVINRWRKWEHGEERNPHGKWQPS